MTFVAYNATMDSAISIDFGQPFPLFPLPNCVLLPHATIPLHIFEPRYRQMTGDALDNNNLIAMALFDGDEWKDEYYNTPPLRPHVCVGYIVRHESLDDGRYNILLQGVCRAKLIEETPNDPYRLGYLEPIEHQQSMEIDLGDQRVKLETLLNDPLLKSLSSVSAIHNWLSAEIPTSVLVDLAIMSICDDIEQRYAMLANNETISRAKWLLEHLKVTRQTLAIAEKFGNGQSTDGHNLN